MALFEGLLLLAMGYGTLGVAYRSLGTGWLPFGPSGAGGRLEFRMDGQPFLYWMAFTFYCALGAWCLLLAFGVLSGEFAPLPLS
jgi:hypothetical protein